MGASSYPERLKIYKLSKKGLTDRQIAGQSGLSIFTVRKWRRKFAIGGNAGLLSELVRPQRGALSNYPIEMRAQLKSWCKQHPVGEPKRCTPNSL